MFGQKKTKIQFGKKQKREFALKKKRRKVREIFIISRLF